jgi:hydroxyethylthiazole kinase-like uncharacterized protein yjeF
MKIHSSADLKYLDQKTIEIQNISSWQLMERASSVLFSAIKEDFDIADTHFTVLCGHGNNGGDGLALARMLYQAGSEVVVYLIKSDSYSEDNLENQQRLNYIQVNLLDLESPPIFKSNTIIIDALFGYGLSRPLDSYWIKFIQQVNDSGLKIISVDMPSGLLADKSTPKASPIVKADIVYTLQCPKLALLQPENANFVKSFKVLNINLEDTKGSQNYYLTHGFIQSLLKSPSRFSHKGTFGHSLIIGGSYGKIGAPLLSTKAALKTGCGLITAHIPKCGYIPFQSAFPEAMVISDSSEDVISNLNLDVSSFSAVGVGMGMGQNEKTIKAFEIFLQKTKLPPVVIDADGLNLLSQNKELLKDLPANAILTPHPKELQRLIGDWRNDFEKLEMARAFSTMHSVILIIKGAHTSIILPDGIIFYNSTGNYGMATGGSGDVLTGIITSLLAQSYSPKHAALIGVYLHGLAGDSAVQKIHPKSLIASDIIEHITDAWKILIPSTMAISNQDL